MTLCKAPWYLWELLAFSFPASGFCCSENCCAIGVSWSFVKLVSTSCLHLCVVGGLINVHYSCTVAVPLPAQHWPLVSRVLRSKFNMNLKTLGRSEVRRRGKKGKLTTVYQAPNSAIRLFCVWTYRVFSLNRSTVWYFSCFVVVALNCFCICCYPLNN